MKMLSFSDNKKAAKYAAFVLFLLLLTSIVSGSFPDVAKAGLSRCAKCNCKAYEGHANTCANCGHSYSSHY